MKKILSLAAAAAAVVFPVCALDESIPIEKAPEIRLVTSDPSVSIPAVVIAGALAVIFLSAVILTVTLRRSSSRKEEDSDEE